MTRPTPEPKPCPFCGSGVLHVSVDNVRCSQCGAWGPKVQQPAGSRSKDVPIAAWNRRTHRGG